VSSAACSQADAKLSFTSQRLAFGFDIRAVLKSPRPPRSRFLAGFCLTLAICATLPLRAQETESVDDAARAFRARRAVQANQNTGHPAQHPLSATTLVARQIAGMAMPDILNELQTRGITFVPDNTQLDRLKAPGVAPELLAALPNVPSHPDPSTSSRFHRL
jgi:hypothetical protein